MKLAIVGRGTVGCMAILHFLRWTDWEIEWIYDPNIPPTFVGEGTTLILPKSLYQNAWFGAEELEEMNSTVKLGIHKKNWGLEGKEYIHSFGIGDVGMHFSAVTFHDLVMKKFGQNPRIKHTEASVVPDIIDADYVLMCTGSPRELTEEFETISHIPVNSAFVSQCPWDYARFNYSLTFARPYGWIFGIPLKHRCAIGYLYNDKITSLDEVKEDVSGVLKELNLVPEIQRHLTFKNYKKKQNFDYRTIYNGNCSFFLEPLEATSTGFSDGILRSAFEIWHGNLDPEEAQFDYDIKLSEIESMIAMHYYAGSSFKTKFWDYAQELVTPKIENEFKNDTEFAKIIRSALTNQERYPYHHREVGSWNIYSYRQNIPNLGLTDKFKKLLDIK